MGYSDALTAGAWIVMIAGSINVVLYTALLFHVKRGSNNKWLLANVTMLLLSAIFMIFMGIGMIKVYV